MKYIRTIMLNEERHIDFLRSPISLSMLTKSPCDGTVPLVRSCRFNAVIKPERRLYQFIGSMRIDARK